MNRGTCEIVGILEPLRFESLCDPETTSTITTNGERLTDYVRVLPAGRSVVPRGNRTLNRMIMIERINKCDPILFLSFILEEDRFPSIEISRIVASVAFRTNLNRMKDRFNIFRYCSRPEIWSRGKISILIIGEYSFIRSRNWIVVAVKETRRELERLRKRCFPRSFYSSSSETLFFLMAPRTESLSSVIVI